MSLHIDSLIMNAVRGGIFSYLSSCEKYMKTRNLNNTNIPLEIGPSCLISDGAQYKYQQIKSKRKEYNHAPILLVISLLFLIYLIRIIKVNIFIIGLLLLELLYDCEMIGTKSVQKFRLVCRYLNNKLKGTQPLKGKRISDSLL